MIISEYIDSYYRDRSAYWITPDGKRFDVIGGATHADWIRHNLDKVRPYIDIDKYKQSMEKYREVLRSGWIRVSHLKNYSMVEIYDESLLPKIEEYSFTFFNNYDDLIIDITDSNITSLHRELNINLDNVRNEGIEKAVNDFLKDKRLGMNESTIYPTIKDIKRILKNNYYTSNWSREILDAFIVGSEAKGIANLKSDLDVAIIISPVKGKDSIKYTENFHYRFPNDESYPNWNGRKLDIQFFYPDDHVLSNYSKIRLLSESVYSIVNGYGQEVDVISNPSVWQLTPPLNKSFNKTHKYLRGAVDEDGNIFIAKEDTDVEHDDIINGLHDIDGKNYDYVSVFYPNTIQLDNLEYGKKAQKKNPDWNFIRWDEKEHGPKSIKEYK